MNLTDHKLKSALERMASAISGILTENLPSIYLYGSCAMDDFRLGWSDIDIMVLTRFRISPAQAGELLSLRQKMSENENDNPYYRLFEGNMLTVSAFLSNDPDCVVYWGSSGEQITDRYLPDSFCLTELKQNGILLYGLEIRGSLPAPAYNDLCLGVKKHCETIRRYAQATGRSLYSFGWLLDIARGIYTLRNGTVTSKTAAAQWVLDNNLCPVPDILETALKVRKNPLKYKNNHIILNYAENLGPKIQRFADVLEMELTRNVLIKGKM